MKKITQTTRTLFTRSITNHDPLVKRCSRSRVATHEFETNSNTSKLRRNYSNHHHDSHHNETNINSFYGISSFRMQSIHNNRSTISSMTTPVAHVHSSFTHQSPKILNKNDNVKQDEFDDDDDEEEEEEEEDFDIDYLVNSMITVEKYNQQTNINSNSDYYCDSDLANHRNNNTKDKNQRIELERWNPIMYVMYIVYYCTQNNICVFVLFNLMYFEFAVADLSFENWV